MRKRDNLLFIFVIVVCVIATVYGMIYWNYERDYVSAKRLYGATYMTMNNEFYRALDESIESELNKQGNKLITLDPALDVDKQNDQIEYLIEQGVKVIFLCAVDWEGITPGLQKAKEAGVQVIAIDTPVHDEELVAATIVSDNYQAGMLCAEELMYDLSEANVLLLVHEQAKSAMDRIDGFKYILEKNENYRIVAEIDTEGQTERTLPKVEEFLEKNDSIQAIMCLNDPTALGALAALDSKHIDSVKVYSVDGSPDGKRLVEEGLLTATASQSPKEMGKRAVKLAYALNEGEEIDSQIVLPVEIINSRNIVFRNVDEWE